MSVQQKKSERYDTNINSASYIWIPFNLNDLLFNQEWREHDVQHAE